MIHIRVEDDLPNSRRSFVCGLGPELPEGDTWLYPADPGSYRADCQGCNPGGPGQLGTPLSQVTGAMLDRMADEWRQ